MSFSKISAGNSVPESINVIIEISAHSDPVKYEVDKETGALFVDRFMATAMYYPANYGYVPQTLSADGDPVDVLVITPVPLNSGCVITCRPVGMLKMVDEKGEDAKLLAVPTDDVCFLYHDIKTPEDLPQHLLSNISHFFEHYKDLEPGKWAKIQGWEGPEAAKAEILSSIKRHKN